MQADPRRDRLPDRHDFKTELEDLGELITASARGETMDPRLKEYAPKKPEVSMHQSRLVHSKHMLSVSLIITCSS